ncbi:hypothetical protein CPC08DRAFT_225626, partial [Agrocybe pediades]
HLKQLLTYTTQQYSQHVYQPSRAPPHPRKQGLDCRCRECRLSPTSLHRGPQRQAEHHHLRDLPRQGHPRAHEQHLRQQASLVFRALQLQSHRARHHLAQSYRKQLHQLEDGWPAHHPQGPRNRVPHRVHLFHCHLRRLAGCFSR